MARDRKRAKQRRARRGTTAGARPEHAPSAPAGGAPGGASEATDDGAAGRSEVEQPLGVGRVERADLPAALEHSGDVDEFDAALIAGAGGVAAGAETLSEAEIEAEAETEGDLTEDELQEGAGSGRGGGNGVSPAQASGAPIRRGNRAIGFLRASWAELQRVQWPDRRHVFQATAVVLGFVAVAGAYLGLADYMAKEIVEFVIG
ncbi:MAG TPA: preprotein translocase subunit SecE [Solirubrobacteraceae bacterium]|nr:preprotein translocase subunit SecE [Solirubrobacteraceae bacterium]